MARTLQFVYYMILCFSVFLFAKNIDALHCNNDNECPPSTWKPFVRCKMNRCIYSRVQPPWAC
ncbi:putative Late nodulin [Medicago truncatula]|uniref:Nodule Cysteine-Rich (NCR) secreted peptide n=1 Tax=Medicago truncatula TaxID=3880 RepID=A0A072V6Y7_MEDTR|nr:Nodule Cysteine-Rich (NCR) secreted peptide [Medicago truncatula]RHN67168.1 putative Late nodulin [Medicago truncatula]